MRKACLSFGGRIFAIVITLVAFELLGLMNFHQYISTKMGMRLLIQNEIENIILVILLGSSIYSFIKKLWRKLKTIKEGEKTK